MIVRVHPGGKDAAGLARYLYGPGKANEHTDQHLVGGSSEVVGEWAGFNLSPREATHLGRVLEASWRRRYAPELALVGVGAGGVSSANLSGGIGDRLAVGQADGVVRTDLAAVQDHVLHVSFALPADAAHLSDGQWQRVAATYMREMGFTGQPGRPDPTWFAVRHGVSTGGNDHIHLVACTVRRDGSRLDVHNSGRRSQDVRRDVLEKLDFVAPLHEPGRAHGTPRPNSFTAAEHNIAKDRAARGEGSPVPDRVQLQRIVRAAAVEATTEAGFITNVLQAGRLDIVAARWQPGTDQQIVTGFKVRIDRGIWLSASELAPDLTLGKLRPSWSDETEETRLHARALWADQVPGERRTVTTDAPAQLDQAVVELAAFNTIVEHLDPHDVDGWQQVEASVAGTTAVIATARPAGVDSQGRPAGFSVDAGRVSDVLVRQALADRFITGPAATMPAPTVPAPTVPAPTVPEGLSRLELATRHLQLAVRATHTDRHAGWLAVTQQLARTIGAITDAKRARGELVAADTLAHGAGAAIQRLDDWLENRVITDADTSPTADRTEQRPPLTAAADAALAASGHARIDPTGRGEPRTPDLGAEARPERNEQPTSIPTHAPRRG